MNMIRTHAKTALVLALAAGSGALAPAPAAGQITLEQLLQDVEYRNLGPFRTGAWITDFAVPAGPSREHLYTFYVGTRNGGVWKTTNNGNTFQPLFDDQPVSSIGDVTLAPSDPDVLYVGTGEAYNARSSYFGNGVYRSDDGGETFRHLGLDETQHIARIQVHPRNPDVAWVAAMGHLFSENPERGVFKTTDGGRTWDKVLYRGPDVGVVDLLIHPEDPDVLWAATYQKTRSAWDYDAAGPESGLWKTTDGGATWSRVSGGFPTGRIGRIGLDVHMADPDVLYAIVENLNMRPIPPGRSTRGRGGEELTEEETGSEVYRSDDGGLTWTKTHDAATVIGGKASYSFNQIRVDPEDPCNLYVIESSMWYSEDCGRTWNEPLPEGGRRFDNMFGDHRTIWVDPLDPERMLIGSDGGVFQTYDRAVSIDHYLNLPLGEVYAIGLDMDEPYNVYAGLQDHEHWKGPSNDWSGVISVEDWITLGTGDGMYVVPDPTDSRWFYSTSEFGQHARVDQVARTRTSIVPRRADGEPRLRWNWVPPIALSPHDPSVLYAGAQVLLRSRDRGDTWEEISPDLTTNVPEQQFGRGNINFNTITTISESPVQPGVIWVGTDDGKVQVTRDAGRTWTDVSSAVTAAGAPEGRWVSRVFASAHAPGTAYVAKNGFHNDDFAPYVFRTTDSGRTWQKITAGLPNRAVNVVWEDRVDPDLLFAGTDNGVWATVDGGGRWASMRGDMPTVPVHDLKVHPREDELVVGTYGRGLFITDMAFLRDVDARVLASTAHLFEPRVEGPIHTSGWGNYHLYGDRYTETSNEPDGVDIKYLLGPQAAGRRGTLTISRPGGEEVRTFDVDGEAGLGSVVWNPWGGGRRGYGFGRQAEPPAGPGRYVVTLEIAGTKVSKEVTVPAS